MTLPASGAISLANIAVEAGLSSTASVNMTWVKSITKPSLQTTAISLNQYYGRSFYQNTTEGNCSNSNCNVGANCVGDSQCINCSTANCVNCTNCDAAPYLQPGANCACTYACNPVTDILYNCANCGGK